MIIRASLLFSTAMEGEANRCAFWVWTSASIVAVAVKPFITRVSSLNCPPLTLEDVPDSVWVTFISSAVFVLLPKMPCPGL